MAAFSKHPSSALLLDHVSGTLGIAHHLVVATHAWSCIQCQNVISFWERIANTILSSSRSVKTPPNLFERCLDTINQQEKSATNFRRADAKLGALLKIGDTILPPPLEGLTPSKLRWLAPGIQHSMLCREPASALHFISVRSGVTLPAHRHSGLELTCVLSGAFRASGRFYTVGDVSEEDDDNGIHPGREQDHLVVAEPTEDCVCIMATTGRLRFSGWMARLLQPLMPF